ncbi:MAG: FAD binding domain-containing protein [Bacillota bacterium]
MFRKYYRPQSIAEALVILADYEGRARVLAGGTDLMLQLKQGEISFEAAVDITAIKELRYITEENDSIKIGALSTHTDLAQSPVLHKKALFLADAARSVGSLQIRNVGTVGGNVVNAQPAADTAVPLMALNAVVTVVSPGGVRQISFDDL